MEYKDLIATDRKTALCLSEMAAIVVDGVSLDSYEKCKVAVDCFNQHYETNLGGAVSADVVWNVIMELRLLPHFTIPPKSISHWRADGALVQMLLWGIVEGYTHWYDNKKSKAEILIEKFKKAAKILAIMDLGTMCSKVQFYEIIADMVMIVKKQNPNASVAEDWLFECLCKYDLHGIGLLEDVCDALFSATIEISASRDMDRVLSGPNGQFFEDYIHTSFVNYYHQGELRFGFAEGAVVMHKVLISDKKPLSLAERLCLRAETDETRLPLLAAMSLLLWSQLLDGPDPEPGYEPSEAFVNMLCNFLVRPGREYSIVVSCVEDLILSGRLRASILSEEIAHSAVSVLRLAELKKWAEHLLCLFDGKIEVDKATKQQYALRFQAEVSQLYVQSDATITFGCCLAMQSWCLEEEKSHFMDLGKCYSRNPGFVDHYRLARMQSLLHRVIPDGRWFHFSHSADQVNDLYPLSENQISHWKVLLAKENATIRLTTKKDAVAAILFMDANYQHIIDQPEPYRSFFTRLTLDLDNPGSFVVTRWFEYLSLLDLGEKAVDFYRQHKKILDLPFCFYPANWHGDLADILRFVHFFDHGSRVVDGIRRSLQLGKTGVLNAFLDSEYRSLIDSPVFWDRALPFVNASILPELAHRFGGKYGLREKAERHLPQESPKRCSVEAREPFYADFYDDPSVLLYSIKTKPAIRNYLKRWIRKVDPDLGNEIDNGGIAIMKIYDPTKDRIVRNRIRCINCNEIIESRHYHDFVICSCGNCAADGGLEYLRRLSRERNGFEELAEFTPREDQN
jgi:hypothetical protein